MALYLGYQGDVSFSLAVINPSVSEVERRAALVAAIRAYKPTKIERTA